MAETAKIINPNKTVILPDKDAGCSLEQSCDGHQLESFLKKTKRRITMWLLTSIAVPT